MIYTEYGDTSIVNEVYSFIEGAKALETGTRPHDLDGYIARWVEDYSFGGDIFRGLHWLIERYSIMHSLIGNMIYVHDTVSEYRDPHIHHVHSRVEHLIKQMKFFDDILILKSAEMSERYAEWFLRKQKESPLPSFMDDSKFLMNRESVAYVLKSSSDTILIPEATDNLWEQIYEIREIEKELLEIPRRWFFWFDVPAGSPFADKPIISQWPPCFVPYLPEKEEFKELMSKRRAWTSDFVDHILK